MPKSESLLKFSLLVVPYFSVPNKPCSTVYNTILLREPFFLFTFMKFIPVSRSPTNTENGTPGSPAYALVVLQKCPKKQHVMSRECICYCMLYMQ